MQGQLKKRFLHKWCLREITLLGSYFLKKKTPNANAAASFSLPLSANLNEI